MPAPAQDNQNPPAEVPGQGQGQAPATPDNLQSFMAKKGFASNDDVVKAYESAEAEMHRKQNAFSTAKKQLESQGFTLNDNGEIAPLGQATPGAGQPYPQYEQPYNPYAWQQQQQFQPQPPPPSNYGQWQQPYGVPQVPFDPYSGEPITHPAAQQLARLPLGVREATVFNAMADQRDQLQAKAFQAENEMMKKAAGFETELRQAMMALPLAQRADPRNWETEFLKIKGSKYDEHIKTAAQQGINTFINKSGFQTPAAGGTGGAEPALSQDQEQAYRWYQQNYPQMFRDKKHFAQRLQNNGGMVK